MPDIAHVSIFTDNDLTHSTDNHFEIKLIARLLNQIYVIQPPILPPRYDDAPPDEYEYSQSPASTFITYPFIGIRYGYATRIYYEDVL